jgi:hypothetical protein
VGIELPPEPMSEMGESAASLHELFLVYVRAGFTRVEAMQLVILVMQEGIRNNNAGSA